MQHVLMLFIAASIKMSFTGAIMEDSMLLLPARAVYVIRKQIFAIFVAAIKVAFTSVIMQETMLLLVERAVNTIMQRILIRFIAAPIR